MAWPVRMIGSNVRSVFKYSIGNGHFRRTYYLYSPEPFHPLADRWPQKKSAEEAVQVIQSGNVCPMRDSMSDSDDSFILHN